MWGITRLLLVILAGTTLFIDSDLIYGQVTHIQRINVQLERLEPCLQIANNKPNKPLEWGLVRKLVQSESELRQDTDRVCEIAANKTEKKPWKKYSDSQKSRNPFDRFDLSTAHEIVEGKTWEGKY